MDMIADALLIAGATGAAAYCMVLAKRLNALKNLDSGLGAAIAALSRQVDEMKLSLESAKALTGDQNKNLSQLTARAEMAAGRLELLLAALHEKGKQRPISVSRPEPEEYEDGDRDGAAVEADALAANVQETLRAFSALRRAGGGERQT
jgi:septal ring factor EnvC (AmiA/AmiB activator)